MDLRLAKEEQNLSTTQIASLWAGITICLPSFMLGGILLPALSMEEALLITLVGNLTLGIFIYWMGLPGVNQGIASVLVSRQVYGDSWGVAIPSLAVIIAMVGWSAILLGIAGNAFSEILHSLTGFYHPQLVTIATGLLIILSSLAGPKKMELVSRISIPSVLILLGWIAYLLVQRYDLVELMSFTPNGRLGLVEAFDIVMGGTIAGVYVSSDLARFSKSRSALLGGVLLGIMPMALVLAGLGMFSQLATGTWNPIGVIQTMGMGIPALLLVILSTWTTNQASLYSGGLSLANLLTPLSAEVSIIFLGLVSTLLAVLDIATYLENWLVLLNYLFPPLIGVVLAHLYLSPRGEGRWELALGAAFIGVVFTFLSPVQIPVFLTALILSSMTYLVLMKLFGRFYDIES